nr:PREDICTED: brain-specific homeobox/POU domain protein 3-like [Opisthocomus hoazin]
MSSVSCTPTSSSVHLHHPSVLTTHHPHHHHHQPSQGLDGELLEHLNSTLPLGGVPGPDVGSTPSHPHSHMSAINHMAHHSQPMNMSHPHGLASHAVISGPETETDPRELESFAERGGGGQLDAPLVANTMGIFRSATVLSPPPAAWCGPPGQQDVGPVRRP